MVEGSRKVDFAVDAVEAAGQWIGAEWRWGEVRMLVVETEAYAAEGDPACHTFFRPSARRFVEEHPPGTAYVYLNYGVHWLFNILVVGPGGPGFVLFRAVQFQRPHPAAAEPRAGAGPGKLTKLLGLDGQIHGLDLTRSEYTHLCLPENPPPVVTTPRIGISRGQDLAWRFCWEGHPAVSRSRAIPAASAPN
jgi:DNA-3-methyladenine glycosylase